MRPFIGNEEKCLVPPDGTAESAAIVMLLQSGRGSRNTEKPVIPGGREVRTKEFIQITVPLIGSRLGLNRNFRSRRSAEFSGKRRRGHFELLDRIHAWHHSDVLSAVGGRLDSIDLNGVAVFPLSIGLKVEAVNTSTLCDNSGCQFGE